MKFPQTAADLEIAAEPQAVLRHYQDVLHALVDVGAELAAMVLAEAKARAAASPGAGAPAAEAAAAYELIAKSMRRSVMLARSLFEPDAARDANAGRRRVVARAGVIRAVEDAIQTHWVGTSAERLETELRERLDAPELADEIGDRPLAEIVAEICRDLGLDGQPDLHRWKRRTPAEVVELWTTASRAPALPPGDRASPPGRLRARPCPEPPD